MSDNQLQKTRKITNLQETPELLQEITSQEAATIKGGYIDPWSAEMGFKLSWGKCDADEIIGPDGKCYRHYRK